MLRMGRLACNCSPRRGVPTGGVPSDPAAAAAEAAAIAARLAELKRKQEAGELTDAEMAELGKAERRLATLGEAQASCDLIAISLRADCELTAISSEDCDGWPL